MARIVAYARVSTDRQAENRTIEQQVERLVADARERGWGLEANQIYRDDGFSGARLDRPALDRVRDAVARGAIERLLITSPDRLARRYAYQVWLLEEFERAGCAVVFLERPPTGDPQDALVLQIRGAVAEDERTVIADRMRRGRLAALRAGRLLPWTVPPDGYRLDPHRPRDPAGVRLDEAEAAVIRRIFGWSVEDGVSLQALARRLTAEGIPSATGQPFWSGSSVGKVIPNHCSEGIAYGNKQREVPARRRHPLARREPQGPGGQSHQARPREDGIPVPVPAISSPEQFGLAQARLASNRQRARRNTKACYWTRGLVSCGRCHLACTIGNNGRQASFHCPGMLAEASLRRGGPCRTRQVRTERLDAAVWEDLSRLLTEPAVLDEALQHAQRGWLSDDERAACQREIRQRQGQVTRQIQRLVDAYAAEALPLDELRTRRCGLEERLATLRQEEQRLAAEGTRANQVQAVAERLEDFRAAIVNGLERASQEERRALVELLVDRIVVDAPAVEIRYIIPLTGLARRKGVVRPLHRARSPGHQATLLSDARVRQFRGRRPVLHRP